MEDYTKIEEYMAAGSDSRIIKKTKNPAHGIIILLAGAAVLIVGARFKMPDALQMGLMAIGAIAAMAGGIMLILVAVSDCGGYRFKPTGSCIKHHRRYINADDRQKMLECIRYADMKQIDQVRKETSTGTLLQAYASKDGAFAVVQVEEYIPHDFVPMTPPVCLEGEQAAKLLNWING